MEPPFRRRDRWSLRYRFWRAERAGRGDRRGAVVEAARTVALGAPVASLVAEKPQAYAEAELRLIGGASLRLGRCHRPTVARLTDVIDAGGVWVERIADHGHCFGVYLRTASGQRLALLTNAVRVGGGGGGALLDLRPLALA